MKTFSARETAWLQELDGIEVGPAPDAVNEATGEATEATDATTVVTGETTPDAGAEAGTTTPAPDEVARADLERCERLQLGQHFEAAATARAAHRVARIGDVLQFAQHEAR